MTDNNNLMIFAVLGIGIYFISKQNGNGNGNGDSPNPGPQERFYNVPGVGAVRERDLPQYGYSYLFGKWLTPQQVDLVLAEYTKSTGNTNHNNSEAVASWIEKVGGAIFGIIKLFNKND